MNISPRCTGISDRLTTLPSRRQNGLNWTRDANERGGADISASRRRLRVISANDAVDLRQKFRIDGLEAADQIGTPPPHSFVAGRLLRIQVSHVPRQLNDLIQQVCAFSRPNVPQQPVTFSSRSAVVSASRWLSKICCRRSRTSAGTRSGLAMITPSCT